ncbi:hypothetical protein [Sphingomonas sp.]|jgi:hypothetical protein|uniref:hypothetical protein n=1 Tax=Sphingomonas sp. TaxID=28214 RepID=UPI002E2F4E9C|nr:hypothetical protein [Sphingomonas sp.]HEX4695454.1 hypothetical protein [Sphingomonas sp.]
MTEQDHAACPAVCRERWSVELAPLGIPTVIIADDPQLIATADAALADWRVETPALEPIIEIRLTRDDAPFDDVSPAIRVEGSRLTLTGGGIAGWADAGTRCAECIVPDRLLGRPSALAEEVIDTLLLFLLTRNGRPPVHASGVMIGNRLLMLAGRSGSGKSTLALAAAGLGLPVLSDDTLYVELDPDLRVWGFPRAIHVFPEDAPTGEHFARTRNGKLKRAVPIGTTSALHADRARLIVLDRGTHVRLDRISAAEAIERLGPAEPGFDLLRDQNLAAIEALAAAGAWRLTLTDDPGVAIALLLDAFA